MVKRLLDIVLSIVALIGKKKLIDILYQVSVGCDGLGIMYNLWFYGFVVCCICLGSCFGICMLGV